MKAMIVQLALDEYDKLITTLEGAKEELEEIERTIDYFVSETPDRLADCLRFLKLAAECADVVDESEDRDE
jgi:hypothetical protein